MYKKTITYTDYNGISRTEDYYFNLTAAEIMELEMGTTGGLTENIQTIVKAKDSSAILKTFKDLILKAYGVKSQDGRRLIKNDEVREEFLQTEAYSMFFMELITDTEACIKFVKNIVPAEAADKVPDKIDTEKIAAGDFSEITELK